MNSRDLLPAVVAAGVLALAGSIGTLVVPESVEATTPSFWKDYNDDGKPDLAIGIPGERVSGIANAGAVQVIYGRNPEGFSTLGQQFFNENNVDATDGPSSGDRFGAALASGDFDDDGFSDLAIGIPGEDIGATSMGIDRGAITILWGSEDGLVEDDAVAIETGPNHHFGSSLVALNMFDQSSTQGTATDGIADLVVGDDRGVTFFLGATRNFLNVPTTPRRIGLRGEDNLASFRIVLAAGNLDSDSPHELIVGMPDKAVGNAAGAGQIAVIDRITPPPSGIPFDIDLVTQDDYNFTSVAGDNFGAAVSIGNLVGSDDGNFVEEVLVGAPGRNVVFNGASRNDAGVVYGFLLGVATALSQASSGVPDNPEAGDRFGASVLIGGFSNTGGLGIAMGAPGEQIGSVDGAGAVIISELGEGGTGTHRYLISQNTANVPGTAQANDNFGATLASGDYDGVGAPDLAIGAPNDNPNGVNNAGSVYVIYHDNETQLTPQTSDILWSQATSGIPSNPQRNDKFGAALR